MLSDKAKRVSFDAMLAALALMLTYAESVLSLASLVPLPGFRLGLANVAVMAALYYCGRTDAVCVAAVKICVSAMLFSTPTSFVFSLFGTVLSLAALTLLSFSEKMPFGFIGLSVISAVFHNLGQILAAVMFFGKAAFSFVPYLLAISLISGVLVGILLCIASPVLNRFLINKTGNKDGRCS